MASIPITVLIHIIIVIGMGIRILFRRLAVNTTLAWLIIIATLPIIGVGLYFFFGDHRLGRKRLKLGAKIRNYYQNAYEISKDNVSKDEMEVSPYFEDLSNVISLSTGFHPSMGNKVRLFDEAGHIIKSLIDDIDNAKDTCFLEFFIINVQGRVIGVMEALERAALRGVECRILTDDFGSRKFLKCDWRERLEKAGVDVQCSLAVGVIKSFSKRSDLRNHRKIVIVDHSIGYIGSYNLIDPVEFKKNSDVGQWVDIMVRLEGHIVSSLAVVFNTDYIFDKFSGDYTKKLLNQFPKETPAPEFARDAVLQLIPSGPEMKSSLIYEVIVAAIYGARKTITIVTPYFVPDEGLIMALTNASKRGLVVTLVIPRKIDSTMAAYASESSFDSLLDAGVKICRYESGMLHTKAILIDDDVSFIGTVNMDLRSFHLNLEVTLAVYDKDLSKRLLTTVDNYIARGEYLERDRWKQRSQVRKFQENVLRLAAPLL